VAEGRKSRTTKSILWAYSNCSFLQVDNRIRFGLKNALALNIIKTGTTIIAVQGWKGGLGHTNTLRILSVPTDPADLELQPLGAN
jgi:pyruvate kinase